MPAEHPKGAVLAAACGDDELSVIGGSHGRHALPVANVPLVRYGVAALARAGCEEVAVVVSPETGPTVRAALAADPGPGVEIAWIELDAMPTFAAALASLAPWLDGAPVAVHDGDGLFATPIAGFVERFRIERPDALLLVAPREDDGRLPLRLVDAPALDPTDDELTGAHVLGPAAVALAARLADGPAADQTLAATVSALRAGGGRVEAASAHGAWRYDGSVDGLLEANRIVLDEIERDVTPAHLASARVEGRVVVHPTATLDRTTIRGPAVIGPHAVLVDTFVGPYTAVGAHARLDGAEIAYSVVLDHAAVRHPGRRVESSLIGHGARVAREFGLPAALRLRVGRQAEVSLG
jgi:glucose-1-phosphate thymidylyltransferase